jgi:hypothetical protein
MVAIRGAEFRLGEVGITGEVRVSASADPIMATRRRAAPPAGIFPLLARFELEAGGLRATGIGWFFDDVALNISRNWG